MNPFPVRRLRSAALLAVAGCSLAPAFAETKGRDSGQLYADNCASCHGKSLEGGKGGSLLNRTWTHGNDEPSLARTITNGIASGGMPGFAKTINPAETMGLATFIRESASHHSDPPPTTDRPFPDGVQHSQEYDFRVETIAEGLEVPWSLSFLPDGRLLVTERIGRLRVIDHGKLLPQMIGGLPPVVVQDEAGLMSVLAHPDFAHNHWVYLTFSDPGANGTAMTKVIRARLDDWTLVEPHVVFSIPREKYQSGYVLFGSRMVFDGDYLFFSVGVRGLEGDVTHEAQDLTVPNGKIHRVFADGRIPPDNPFVHRSGAWPSIWAYGVRNPQGLARDPRDGALWETEHGPRGGDELNHIERGKNYGWPIVTQGMNYDGTPITDKTEAPGMTPPVVNWTPSIAASEIEFYTGDQFPKWKGQLFMGSLATQKFLRHVVVDGRVTHTEEIFADHGRVRDIKTGPDGMLYLALELIGKPGKVIRLVPASPPAAVAAAPSPSTAAANAR